MIRSILHWRPYNFALDPGAGRMILPPGGLARRRQGATLRRKAAPKPSEVHRREVCPVSSTFRGYVRKGTASQLDTTHSSSRNPLAQYRRIWCRRFHIRRRPHANRSRHCISPGWSHCSRARSTRWCKASGTRVCPHSQQLIPSSLLLPLHLSQDSLTRRPNESRLCCEMIAQFVYPPVEQIDLQQGLQIGVGGRQQRRAAQRVEVALQERP